MYLFIRENLLGGSYITMILMDLTECLICCKNGLDGHSSEEIFVY
ncbi:hypothetical protein NC651_040489 [Populus alba x Populus x berolinensis]|nr:hypothetical protein NC651_040489 [Populus alba x Populus x berolinensis]